MLLVHDDQADLGQRREHGEARPDDDIHVACPDPTPLVSPFAIGEPRVHERHAGIEIGTQAVHERQGEGDLGHEDERRATKGQRSRDGFHVDRRLAPAGHAIEEQRARVASLDGIDDPGDRDSLLRGQIGGWRTPATDAHGPAGERPAGPYPDLGRDEPAARESGDGRGPVRGGKRCGLDRAAGTECSEVRQRCDLARSQGPPRRALAGGQHGGSGRTRVGQADPALMARPARGSEQGPVEGHRAIRGERPQPPQQPGSPIGRGKLADWPRAGLELREQVRLHGIGHRGGTARRGGSAARREHVVPARDPFRDEFQPLQQARRQHRAHDQPRRCQVMVGDPGREAQRERREQRAIGADSVHDRLGHDAGHGFGRAQDHAEGLPAPELHEDRLAIF